MQFCSWKCLLDLTHVTAYRTCQDGLPSSDGIEEEDVLQGSDCLMHHQRDRAGCLPPPRDGCSCANLGVHAGVPQDLNRVPAPQGTLRQGRNSVTCQDHHSVCPGAPHGAVGSSSGWQEW